MRTTTLRKPKTQNAKLQLVLPLRNGEHLSREEFERRWDATPGLHMAELIEGIVFVPPPTSTTHSTSHDALHHCLSRYARSTPGVRSYITPSLRLDNKNEFQPDCVLRIASSKRGRSRVAADDYLEGAPELVAEVAVSSADYDAHEKRWTLRFCPKPASCRPMKDVPIIGNSTGTRDRLSDARGVRVTMMPSCGVVTPHVTQISNL